MLITICIGSSCHLKGSRQVVEQMQQLVADHNLKDEIELKGTFCMGNCANGVCVSVDEKIYYLKKEDVRRFFETEILPNCRTT